MVKQPKLLKNSKPVTKMPRLGKFVQLQHKIAGRFWVKIVKKTDDKLYGRVDNRLLGNTSFNIGDIIVFELDKVFT